MRRLIVLVTAVSTALLAPLTFRAGPAAASTPGKTGVIAFSMETGPAGWPQVFTVRRNGSDLRQLTTGNVASVAVDWSPDGRRLTFSQDNGAGQVGIVILDVASGVIRSLSPPGRVEVDGAFTPDGRHLVYECVDCPGGDGVFIMRDDGTDRRRLSTNPFGFGDGDPNVSPDGSTVTFVRGQVPETLQSLEAVDISGRHERQIVPASVEVGVKHDWAPDGQHIVLIADADRPGGRSPNVATVRPDGSDLRMVTHYSGGKQGAYAGSYSPDGRWIVMRVENPSLNQFALYRIRPDGTRQRLISQMPSSPFYIDWGPRPRHGH